MNDKAATPLLKLLEGRKSWNLPPYTLPHWEPGRIDLAAKQHGAANNSDPFSENRMRLYLSQGFTMPSEVLEDATKAITLRAQQHKGGN